MTEKMINPGSRSFAHGNRVRLSIPASVAGDIGSFQKSLTNLAELLGCGSCFSGADCTFQITRDWVINERLEARPAVNLEPDPHPWRGVTATLPANVSYDIKKIQQVVATIAGQLGCAACCSGFDLNFRQELEFIVDQKANVRPVSQGF